MTPCSEAAIDSDLRKLQELRDKVCECLNVLAANDVGRSQITMAASFLQMAIEALTRFKSERALLQ